MILDARTYVQRVSGPHLPHKTASSPVVSLLDASAKLVPRGAKSSRSLLKWQCIREQQITCSSARIAYRCPTCSQPLRESDQGTLICDAGHTVLRAKEGHVHLRPSGRKVAINAAGDSPEMVSTLGGLAGHCSIMPRIWSLCILLMMHACTTVVLAAVVPEWWPFPLCQVKARRRFFDAGHYNIIADQIGRIVVDALAGCTQVGSSSATRPS